MFCQIGLGICKPRASASCQVRKNSDTGRPAVYCQADLQTLAVCYVLCQIGLRLCQLQNLAGGRYPDLIHFISHIRRSDTLYLPHTPIWPTLSLTYPDLTHFITHKPRSYPSISQIPPIWPTLSLTYPDLTHFISQIPRSDPLHLPDTPIWPALSLRYTDLTYFISQTPRSDPLHLPLISYFNQIRTSK